MKVGQFQELFTLDTKDKDSLDFKIKAIAILTGKTVDEIEDLPIDEFKKLASKIEMPDKYSDKLVFVTKVAGVKFEAILNIKEITTAEFLEVSKFTESEESIIKNLHKLLAIFYKPKSRYFGLKKVTMRRAEAAELIKEHMDIKIAYPLAVFFLKSWKNFTPIMERYLEKKMKMMVKELKEIGEKKSR